MKVDDILSKLSGVRRTGDGWVARCPAHKDQRPSLSIHERNGKILLKCFAGCSTEAVLAAVRLQMSDLFTDSSPGGNGKHLVEVYDYQDEEGTLLFQVCRYDPKEFKQRRPDGNGGWKWSLDGVRRVLYHLPEVLKATSVLIVEGEKDCETARKLGLVGTTNPHGSAGGWRSDYSECLRGKHVAIIADADPPGLKHAWDVARSLVGVAAMVKLIEALPNSKDLSVWVSKGGTQEGLLEIIRQSPEYKPSADGAESQGPRPTAITRPFSAIHPEPLRWLWPSRIPLGKLTLLVGDPGLGKSLLTLDMAARISTGRGFSDGTACEIGSVVILSAEDDPADTIRPRLDAADADVSRIHLLEAVRTYTADGKYAEKGFSLEADIAALEEAVTRTQARLLIVDPVSAYLSSTDSRSNSEVRSLLAPLTALAAKHSAAVLAITHFRKSGGSAIHRAMDSLAFVAAARVVFGVCKDPENEARRLMLPVKQNLSPDGGGLAYRIEAVGNVARVAWEPGTVTVRADDVIGGFDSREDRSERRESEEWLRDFLSDGPRAAADIRRESTRAGLSWITVRRSADAMSVQKQKGGFNSGWAWGLPEGAHHEDAHPIDSTMSTFDGATENKGDSDQPTPEGAHLTHTEHLRRLSTFAEDKKVATFTAPMSLGGEEKSLGSTTPELSFDDDEVSL